MDFKRLLKTVLCSILIVSSFAFIVPQSKAMSVTEGNSKDLQRFFKDVNFEELVEKISENDTDLEKYGLTVDSNGNIISLGDTKSINYSQASDFTYPGSSIKARIGDIVVAVGAPKGMIEPEQKDSASYLSGHVAVVTSTNTVSMAGPGIPGPNIESLSKFLTRPNVYVVRLVNSQIVTNAADWAARMYNAKPNWKWELRPNSISQLDPNYCSKFVYQAFNKGNNGSILASPPPLVMGIVEPRSFVMKNFYPNTDEKLVYTKGSIPGSDFPKP